MKVNSVVVNLLHSPKMTSIGVSLLEEDKHFVFHIGTGYYDPQPLFNVFKRSNIIIGYNISKLDSIVLSYVLNGLSKTASEIYQFRKTVITALRNKTEKQLDEYIQYKTLFYKFGTIDLMTVNNMSAKTIEEASVYFRCNNIPVFLEKDIHEDNIQFVHDTLIERNNNLKHMYERSIETLISHKVIMQKYGIDTMNNDSAKLSMSIFNSIYAKYSGTNVYSLREQITEYTSIRIKDILFKDYVFENKDFVGKYEIVKNHVITQNNNLEVSFIGKGAIHKFKQGGLHSSSNPANYISSNSTKYVYLDLNSYYANVIKKFKICPFHIDETAFLSTIEEILELRKEFPQNTLIKKLLTSLSGNLSAKTSPLRDYKESISMYINGELLILQLIDSLESRTSGKCIMSNTDGIILEYSDGDLENITGIMQRFSEYLGAGFKKVDIDKLFVKDVNNYFYTNLDGEISGSGIFKNDFTESLTASVIKDSVIANFLYGSNINEFIINEKDLSKFLFSIKFDSTLRVYFETLDSLTEIPQFGRYVCVNKIGNVTTDDNNKSRKSAINGYAIHPASNTSDIADIINYTYYTSKANAILQSSASSQLSMF